MKNSIVWNLTENVHKATSVAGYPVVVKVVELIVEFPI